MRNVAVILAGGVGLVWEGQCLNNFLKFREKQF